MRRTPIESIVRDLIRDHNIKTPPVAVENIARALGAVVRYSPVKEGEISGFLYRDGKDIVIGVNSLHHPNRQRFTVAHEIGHLLLHEGREVQVHVDKGFRVNLRNEASSKATDQEEIEANLFASELLMPEDMLLADLGSNTVDIEDDQDLKRLAERYGVSGQAMAFRLNRLLPLNLRRVAKRSRTNERRWSD